MLAWSKASIPMGLPPPRTPPIGAKRLSTELGVGGNTPCVWQKNTFLTCLGDCLDLEKAEE